MKIPVFDGHCDTIGRLTWKGDGHIARNDGQWDLDKLEGFAPQAQFFALFWDSADPNAEQMVQKELALFREECRRYQHRIRHCRTIPQAQEAWKNGEMAAFLSVEGAELIGCSIEGLHRAYAAGVRAVNLTWNHANALSGSNADHPERGLTPMGREYVREMQRLGMLVDVSHLSDPGFWDVMEEAEKPVVATHSNSRSVFSHPRNLTDEQFTAIMNYHGVVGLNAYAAFLGEEPVTCETLLAHTEHFLSLGGAETVVLGGDWDGCDRLPEGCTGIWNWADFYETLLRHNYPEALVQNLFFHNMKRTVNQVCTM